MRTINLGGTTFVHFNEKRVGKATRISVEVENVDDFCYLYPTRKDTTLKILFNKLNDDKTRKD